jgi:hypothetical protein
MGMIKNIKDLKDLLQISVTPVVVEYIKKDKTSRIMKSTLDFNKIPKDQHPKGTGKQDSDPDFVNVWSVDDNGWRKFRFSAIKSVIANNQIYSIKNK